MRYYCVERDVDRPIAFDTYRSFNDVEKGDSYHADLGRREDTPGMLKTTNENASNVEYCCKYETCCDKYEILLNEVRSLSTKFDVKKSKMTIYLSYARKSPYTAALKRRLANVKKCKEEQMGS